MMSILKYIFINVIVCVLGMSVSAQNVDTTVGVFRIINVDPPCLVKFNGTVVGVSGNNYEEPIPFAIVRCRDENDKIFADTTDFDGKFDICLTEGEYDIEIQYIGFRPFQRHILVTDSKPVVIKMQASVCDDLEDMIIIHYEYPTKIEMAPMPLHKRWK